MKISETETLSYEIYNSKDLDRVADAVAEAFINSDPTDPMTIAEQWSVNELADYVKMLSEWAGKHQLTVVTKDKATDEVVGVVLAGDFASYFPLTPENRGHITNKIEPIMELFESLTVQYKRGKQIQAGEYLYIHMLAVSRKHQRKKIAQNSLEVCLNNGIKKGFSYAFTESSDSVSQHIFGKLGFIPRHQVDYQQFTYQGQKVFPSTETDRGIMLMDKSLS